MPDAASDAPPVLRTEVADRICTITLNRPERRNALDGTTIAALDAAVKDAAADPEVKVVVLTGAAAEGRHGGFCSGGDRTSPGGPGMELGVPSDALEGDLARHDRHAAMLLHLMPKPTIAMIGGPAVGAGFSLAGACDLRYASTDAVLAAGFAPNGLSGDYGGSVFWTEIVGTARTRELYLLNRKVPADEALRLGMVHEVFPPEELRAATMERARALAAVPSDILARTKANLNEAEATRERRRWLFAHEAANQIEGVAARTARAAAAAARRREQPRADGTP
ncbi:MAG TPA: enoyl-CoA hydratase-related protein [Acidimicrobiales bacterium]